MSLAPKLASTYRIDGSKITYLFIGFSLMGVFAPFLGYHADRLGIKRLIILGLAVFMSGGIVVACFGSAAGYFIGRSLMGIGYYSLLSLTTAYISSIVDYGKLGAISGLSRLAVAGAFFASPLAGAYFALKYSIPALYGLIAGASFLLMILAFFIPDVKSSGGMDVARQKF